jgi:hypothetical protein
VRIITLILTPASIPAGESRVREKRGRDRWTRGQPVLGRVRVRGIEECPAFGGALNKETKRGEKDEEKGKERGNNCEETRRSR